jgi:transcriptional regulator with XRE-family HTH domain
MVTCRTQIVEVGWMGAFGEALKEARQLAGLTQSELAERVGISGAYLSYLETGKRIPPPRILVTTLADSLGSDASHLWQLARHERASHLDKRIEGSAPSLRASIHTERNADPCPLPADEIASAVAALHEDPSLRGFVLQLVDAMPDRESRRQFLSSLSGVMQTLLGTEGESE